MYNKNKTEGKLGEFKKNKKLDNPSLYQPSDALIGAINGALRLGVPLLLTGKPGTGKTGLAYHLADYFTPKDLSEEDKKLRELIVFTVRTTTTATDLFYHYDSLRHFQYIQDPKSERLTPQMVKKKFIRFQGIGEAIWRANEHGIRSIVLIDEIDKAPRDLPNDILVALERLEFDIPEMGGVMNSRIVRLKETSLRPIILLTSNSEKALPDAFLRRCAYFHIEFPDKKELIHILKQKIITASELDYGIIVNHFDRVKKLTKQKEPATAELLYWAIYMQQTKFDINILKKAYKDLTIDEKKLLKTSYIYLVKNQTDLKLVEKAMNIK